MVSLLRAALFAAVLAPAAAFAAEPCPCCEEAGCCQGEEPCEQNECDCEQHGGQDGASCEHGGDACEGCPACDDEQG